MVSKMSHFHKSSRPLWVKHMKCFINKLGTTSLSVPWFLFISSFWRIHIYIVKVVLYLDMNNKFSLEVITNTFKCVYKVTDMWWYIGMNDPLMGSNSYRIDVLCLLICHKGKGDIQRWRRLIVPRRNRFLNTSWAVGLTYWIVYLQFFLFRHMQLYIYVLIHHVIFWHYLCFLNILYFFKYSCTNIFHRRSLCTFEEKCIKYSFSSST